MFLDCGWGRSLLVLSQGRIKPAPSDSQREQGRTGHCLKFEAISRCHLSQITRLILPSSRARAGWSDAKALRVSAVSAIEPLNSKRVDPDLDSRFWESAESLRSRQLGESVGDNSPVDSRSHPRPQVAVDEFSGDLASSQKISSRNGVSRYLSLGRCRSQVHLARGALARRRPFQGVNKQCLQVLTRRWGHAEIRRNTRKTGQSRVGIAGGVILRECTVSLDTPAPQGDRSREDRAGDRAKPSKRVRALSTPSRSRLRLCRPHRRSRCGRRNLCRCWPSCREVPRFLAWIEQLLPTSPEKTGRKPRMDQRPF